MHIGCVERKLAIANENLVDVSQTVEVVINAFDGDHSLTRAEDSQGLIFQTVGGHIDIGQLTDFRKNGVVGSNGLALNRCYLELRVERREERCYKVVETIKDGKGHDHGHNDADNGDAADDIDGIG